MTRSPDALIVIKGTCAEAGKEPERNQPPKVNKVCDPNVAAAPMSEYVNTKLGEGTPAVPMGRPLMTIGISGTPF